MERKLRDVLISSVRGAALDISRAKNNELYDKAREARAAILRAAKEADSQVAEFGDDTTKTQKRLVVCPIDSEMNFKAGYSPGYTTMIGYFEGPQSVFSVVYRANDNVLLIAERGSGVQLDGKRIRVDKNGRLGSSLVGVTLDSFDVVERRGDKNLRLIGAELVAKLALESAGVRMSGSLGSDVLAVVSGGLGGLISPYIEPDRRAVYLALSEAGMTVTDFSGENATLDTLSIVAASKDIHRELMLIAKTVSI